MPWFWWDEVVGLLVLLQGIVQVLLPNSLDVEGTHQFIIDLVVVIVRPTLFWRTHK